jgi:hypothetical protein
MEEICLNYTVLFIAFAVLALIFSRVAKGVIVYAPTIGWFSAISFLFIASIFAYKSRR